MREWGKIAALALGIALVQTACKPAATPPKEIPVPSPSPTATPKPKPSVSATPSPTPIPTPPPPPMIGRKDFDFARLYNGLTIRSEFLAEQGEGTASQDRSKPGSYEIEVKLKIRVPKASQTIEEIGANTSKLPHLLYGLPQLLKTARVSPAYETLYSNKLAWNRARLTELDELISRHNFFDCDTILELESPDTGRKAIFAQGDMDVNTDGSDGDRNVTVDDSSPFFQPQTSYRWPKVTERASPFIAKAEARIKELKAGSGSATQIENLQNRIRELKRFSFLVSDTDPFIVLPGFMLRDAKGPYAPKLGDYAIVIYGTNLYPAIVGDAGPSFKWGEASMRLCRELDAKASANRRPVSSLEVSYLVFPGSADETPSVPDLDRWHERCNLLLAEIGGSPVELHRWTNLVKPWPTPTPTPTPSPTPSPEATPVESPAPSPENGLPLASPTVTPGPSPSVTPLPSPNPPPQELLATPSPTAN